MDYPLTKKDHWLGITAALLVMSMWIVNLMVLLRTEIGPENWYIVPLFFLQIFLYTGLFITAHDAMHGVICHRNRRLNDLLGQIALTLFALFSLHHMLPKHKRHHAAPASEKDPDFHDGIHRSLFFWYFRFFKGYVSWIQLIGMGLLYNLLHYVLGVDHLNLILFWAVPSFLSSFQLFYFGTYLPHRESDGGYADEHRARSNDYPEWLSLITCYHFGYHHEHHCYPWVPWWKLPRVRRDTTSKNQTIKKVMP